MEPSTHQDDSIENRLFELTSRLRSRAEVYASGLRSLWSLNLLIRTLLLLIPLWLGFGWVVLHPDTVIFKIMFDGWLMAFAAVTLLLSFSVCIVAHWLDELIELVTMLLMLLFILSPVLLCAGFWRTVVLARGAVAALPSFITIQTPRYWEQSFHILPKAQMCDKCNSIVDKSALLLGTRWAITWAVERYRYHSPAKLERSARSCHLCNLLLGSLVEVEPNPGSRQALEFISDPRAQDMRLDIRRHGTLLRLSIRGSGTSSSRPLVIEEVSTTPVTVLADTMEYTSSMMNVDWARACIQTCRHEHTVCKHSAISRQWFQPARVLDLSPYSLQTIRLRETAQEPIPLLSDYIALSHCWGGTIDMQLRRSSLSRMKHSIQIAELPKTFRDAIHITRELRIRYLWIDSLCIIQDDERDWKRESSNMGLIYANALCTLAATAAINSEFGCFTPIEPFTEDCILRRSGNSSLVVRSWIRDEASLAKLFDQRVEPAPLNTRGWAFQERMLAQRVLHFVHGLVLFECNTLRASEYHPEGVPYPLRTSLRSDGKQHSAADIRQLLVPDQRYIRKTKKVYIPHPRIRPRIRRAGWNSTYSTFGEFVDGTYIAPNPNYQSQQDKVATVIRLAAYLGMRGAFQMLLTFNGTQLVEKLGFHDSWFEIVGQYSARYLTKHTDKVMAIAGVAAFIQERTKLTFVAGLWKETLPLNLLWSVMSLPKPRPERRVPTWSWVSVDGPISHRLKVVLKEGDVVDPRLLLRRDSSYDVGQAVSKGVLNATWEHVYLHIGDYYALPMLEINYLIHNAQLRLTCCTFRLSSFKLNFVPDVTFDTSATGYKALLCIPILSFRNRSVHPLGSAIQLHGIAVRLRDGDSKYERVGYFWTADEAEATDILGSLSQPLDIWLV